jgi:hypothetical protein
MILALARVIARGLAQALVIARGVAPRQSMVRYVINLA